MLLTTDLLAIFYY